MPATVTNETAVPSRIGPYDILYEIGRGGMGVVYRAARAAGGPQVALKMPSRDLADLFGCMRREIHALSRLRHPGVVRIIEEGVEKGVPWYAMELLDTRSLDGLLNISESHWDEYTEVLPFERAKQKGAIARALARASGVRRKVYRLHWSAVIRSDSATVTSRSVCVSFATGSIGSVSTLLAPPMIAST